MHKLKILAAFKNINVKNLIEEVIQDFLKNTESGKLKFMSEEEKENLGLYLAMKEAEDDQFVDEKEVRKILKGG